MFSTKRASPQEVAEIKENFSRHDKDKDGAINPAEFKAMLARMGVLLTPQDEQKLFTAMDKDRSGKIEVGEFIDHYHTILALEKKAEEQKINDLKAKTLFSEAEIRAMYANYKQIGTTHNDDGVIDKQEFRQMMLDSQMDSVSNMVFYDGLFRMFDRDGSGDVDFNEFVLSLALYHNKLVDQNPDEKSKFFFYVCDVDGDGYISHQDLSKILIDCCSAQQLQLPPEHFERLVTDTFRKFGCTDERMDFQAFKAIAARKGL
eukprot:TRINITY_DN1538_c0_g1_i1.p1 TRINITY_DN1538_c0_g1~~TRINITY_DN1538_c0_g1_i1.p1  ORF type:complete len:260 (-),score=79.72 TRINITY_DN1538_c0_g1_i1:865-1644(-)